MFFSAMPLTERDLIWFVKNSEIYGFDCFQKKRQLKNDNNIENTHENLLLGFVCSSNIEHKIKQEQK